MAWNSWINNMYIYLAPWVFTQAFYNYQVFYGHIFLWSSQTVNSESCLTVTSYKRREKRSSTIFLMEMSFVSVLRSTGPRVWGQILGCELSHGLCSTVSVCWPGALSRPVRKCNPGALRKVSLPTAPRTQSHSVLYSSSFWPAVLLSKVSVTCSQLQSTNLKGEIPETSNWWVLNCATFWAVWWNLVLCCSILPGMWAISLPSDSMLYVQNTKVFWERERGHIHITFIKEHCYNYPILLLVTVVSLLLCLIYRLNFIIGM